MPSALFLLLLLLLLLSRAASEGLHLLTHEGAVYRVYRHSLGFVGVHVLEVVEEVRRRRRRRSSYSRRFI